MIEIKKHGSFLNVDQDGFIIPKVDKKLLQNRWLPIIENVIAFYQDKFQNNLHSVYIRGSVAKGEAVDYISDLDSYCILNEDPGEVDSPFSQNFQEKMNVKYPFCTHIEISFIEKEKIKDTISHRRRSFWEELIKTQSICVYGDNLATNIEKFKVKDMLGHSYFIEDELKKLPEYFREESGDPAKLKETCIWIMRRVVRSGFDLVIEREGQFSRDLYLCYESFVKYYPEHATSMFKVLELSLNPISDIIEINRVLKDITVWLVEEINKRIDLSK